MRFKLLSLFLLFLLYTEFEAQRSDFSEKVNASFTYILQAKPSKREPNKHYKEFFSLQVTDKQAFFSSQVLAKRDSISKVATKTQGNTNVMDFRNFNMPKTRNPYVIIQNVNSITFFEYVGLSLFSYENVVISNWILKDESKLIENFLCKKAELHYKGREWIAWYCPEIPLPYGPYKFSGLPGLIVQIADKTGEYGFRLVAAKSSNETSEEINLKLSRYTKAKKITQKELEKALDDFNENLANNPDINSTLINVDKNFYRERREKYLEFKKDFNPLEISD